MTYEQALRQLLALSRFGMRRGLDGMRSLLALLGHPERGLAVVHVGGTNGKGSTAALIDSALRQAGRRTGLYTSPHLHRLTERIHVDGVELNPDEAAALAARVLKLPGEHTFFEAVTAMAFLAFAAHHVDVAVLEVGLGGRLDATNVVEQPLCTVITSIALDHIEVLGGSLTDIAREKAGIFKAGAPAVIACDDAGALDELLWRAEEVGAPVSLFGRDFADAGLPPLGLAGAHQRRNAALARQALHLLPPSLRPDVAAIERGFLDVRWPGRLERVADDVLVDAAHNLEGAQALAAALPAIAQGRPITLVLGVVADKDARGMVETLAPLARRVVLTAPPSPRALSPTALHALLPSAEVAPDAAEALARARDGRSLTVVAGSIFLIARVRQLITGEPSDAIVVQDPLRPQNL